MEARPIRPPAGCHCPQAVQARARVAAFVPQALYIEMGFSIGFTAAANIIHARQVPPAL